MNRFAQSSPQDRVYIRKRVLKEEEEKRRRRRRKRRERRRRWRGRRVQFRERKKTPDICSLRMRTLAARKAYMNRATLQSPSLCTQNVLLARQW